LGVVLTATVAIEVTQKRKVSKVMHEYKRRTLESGSGKKVRNRKQAIAIAMSESGQSRKRKSGR
jgi:hypothetical protein